MREEGVREASRVDALDEAEPQTGESLVTPTELARAKLAIAAGVAADGPPSAGAFSWMRRVLGLTAGQLAKLLDVKVRTISRWETGAYAVTRLHALRNRDAALVSRSRSA